MEEAIMDVEMPENKLKDLREATCMSRKDFAESFGIPLRTMEDWEAGRRKMPEYLLRLMLYKIKMEGMIENCLSDNREGNQRDNVSIICDAEGNKIVVINDIRFKGRQNIQWNDVEEFLKEYVGKSYKIAETAEKVYIGSEFPDEYTGSIDTKKLKGTNAKAKANAAQGIEKIIEIATNKSCSPNYGKKHKKNAAYGWYRYDTRFAIPVYDEKGDIVRYNVFKARMLVRHADDNKLYLYDLLRIKKETSKPHEQ